MTQINKRIIMHYGSDVVDEPIIYALVKDYKMIPNIFKARVSPEKEGYLAMQLSGEEEDYYKSLEYLKSLNIQVEDFAERVVWDQNICIQCGACTGICPSKALYLKRPEMTVAFDEDKCIVCNQCICACPVHAVRLDI